jgi:hypothetical protein
MPAKPNLRTAADERPKRLPVSPQLIEQARSEAFEMVSSRYNPAAADFEVLARADYYLAFARAMSEHHNCKRGALILPHDGSDTRGRERPSRKAAVGSAEHVEAIAEKLQFALTPELSFKIAREIAKDRLPP